MEIESFRVETNKEAVFSILIPTWNNLAYLKLCVESLQRHSSHSHQIIVHVNEGADGSLDWLRETGLDHTWSKENVGVCHALNAAARLASTDYIVFFNDDMVALPGWDEPLHKEIQSLDHRNWFLSSTMIEPTDTGNACALAPHDFGRTTEDFQEEKLLAVYKSWPMQDWTGATWPPNVVHRETWEKVGGYSIEFSPGMSSDPDFSMKLWQAGIRYFKGLAASRVYHFQTKSTGKVKKNDGPRQFLEKWKLSQGSFNKHFLRRGQPWSGPLQDPGSLKMLLLKLKGRLKRLT